MKDKKKKILKIIQIIYDILSLAFIVFVSVALAVAPRVSDSHNKQEQQETTEVVREKPNRKNATMTSSGSFLYSYGSEVGSGKFLDGFFNTLNFSLTDIRFSSSGSRSFSNATPICYAVDWVYVEYPNLVSSSWKKEIKGFLIQWSKLGEFNTETTATPKGLVYDFNLRPIFVDSTQDTTAFVITYQVIIYIDSTRQPLMHFVNQMATAGSAYRSYAIIWDSSLGNSILPNWLEGGDTSSSYAYQEGYNKGYLDGSTGLDSNVFTLIGQSFTAISGLFAIELLPGFPLWILVFTPLIITVVIVVIKMIKG